MDYSYNKCVNYTFGNYYFIINNAFPTKQIGVYYSDETRGLLGKTFDNYKELKSSICHQFTDDYHYIESNLEKIEYRGGVEHLIIMIEIRAFFNKVVKIFKW
jgi:hypothetical protein